VNKKNQLNNFLVPINIITLHEIFERLKFIFLYKLKTNLKHYQKLSHAPCVGVIHTISELSHAIWFLLLWVALWRMYVPINVNSRRFWDLYCFYVKIWVSLIFNNVYSFFLYNNVCSLNFKICILIIIL
jgi:hypothetical protein